MERLICSVALRAVSIIHYIPRHSFLVVLNFLLWWKPRSARSFGPGEGYDIVQQSVGACMGVPRRGFLQRGTVSSFSALPRTQTRGDCSCTVSREAAIQVRPFQFPTVLKMPHRNQAKEGSWRPDGERTPSSVAWMKRLWKSQSTERDW